ncbi:hypothetical protein FA95DRAFT_778357 [Auriscalpium vulgare]|uniref:Uncharacterized protein n=1 Tax=Auriscalpium vulgare TaxID=40419 RepID=A0ACB8S224_9AGAM|nr:hypothetical protein FA95DRAFT_778357 [Auriscalpium vulgare]
MSATMQVSGIPRKRSLSARRKARRSTTTRAISRRSESWRVREVEQSRAESWTRLVRSQRHHELCPARPSYKNRMLSCLLWCQNHISALSAQP